MNNISTNVQSNLKIEIKESNSAAAWERRTRKHPYNNCIFSDENLIRCCYI
ncbi:MAG TPA: hypothetical protein VEW92_04435 [Nitrososphaeraceae archaeon]|nr:hypothetical protein [Nitrososphaeraceae archaeon]